MNTKLLTTAGIMFLASLFTTGCKKYEDGPNISLIPRKDRVANTWIVEEAYADNQDVSDDYDQYEIYFTNDGDAELTAEYTLFSVDYTIETDGTWEFTNNQENIRVDFENDDADAEYQILRLTSKELWLRQIGQEVELHLAEK